LLVFLLDFDTQGSVCGGEESCRHERLDLQAGQNMQIREIYSRLNQGGGVAKAAETSDVGQRHKGALDLKQPIHDSTALFI
jgi:hypothetical protein